MWRHLRWNSLPQTTFNPEIYKLEDQTAWKFAFVGCWLSLVHWSDVATKMTSGMSTAETGTRLKLKSHRTRHGCRPVLQWLCSVLKVCILKAERLFGWIWEIMTLTEGFQITPFKYTRYCSLRSNQAFVPLLLLFWGHKPVHTGRSIYHTILNTVRNLNVEHGTHHNHSGCHLLDIERVGTRRRMLVHLCCQGLGNFNLP